MAAQLLHANSSILNSAVKLHTIPLPSLYPPQHNSVELRRPRKLTVLCCENGAQTVRTCKNCKTQYDPLLNHPRACRYHTAHFGGETRRKFESVYSGGTMDTPEPGKISQYWHCCGSEDPFDTGCTASPHVSYDD